MVGFDIPGHLNPDFDYEFDEDQILEGDFYRQRSTTTNHLPSMATNSGESCC